MTDKFTKLDRTDDYIYRVNLYNNRAELLDLERNIAQGLETSFEQFPGLEINNHAFFEEMAFMYICTARLLNVSLNPRVMRNFYTTIGGNVFTDARTPDKGYIPTVLSSMLHIDVEKCEAERITSEDLPCIKSVPVGYQNAILTAKDEDPSLHFKKRRRVSKSKSQYMDKCGEYTWKLVDNYEAIRLDFEYAFMESHSRFYEKDENPVRIASFAMDPFLAMLRYVPEAFYVFEMRNKHTQQVVQYSVVIVDDRHKQVRWLMSVQPKEHRVEYMNNHLGVFAINKMFLFAHGLGYDFNMGIFLPYKEMWKPDRFENVNGFEWNNPQTEEA